MDKADLKTWKSPGPPYPKIVAQKMPKINQNCTTVKYEIFIQGDVSIILRVFRFTDLIPQILGFKDLIGTQFFVQPVNLKTL